MNWIVLLIIISATLNTVLTCSRIPQGTTAAKSPVDESYMISISGNPITYVPGQKYNVSLIAYNGQSFISFMLALERDGKEIGNIHNVGYFELADLTETRFSPRCASLVENTNTNVKTRIEVIWVAPAATESGCIYLRATVAKHRDVWFMDDGFLTKKICEEEIDDIDSQPSIVNSCCACDEAKYELTFEGKWSRHTHPKDFPANSWRTRFSDIIGASHTLDYRFWQYGQQASEGLREVAEHGSTRTLESELKDQSNQIRTIIKARGIAFPHVTGKTFAVFRVDSKHHLISLVSMIDPSPDWIVGVSGLELCLPNCSWVENKVHNLYPWDAGTDSGPSYMSADQPQIPPDVIRRIKSNYPNDPRSPFYDSTGAPMKPLATLHINRRRLYEKICKTYDYDDDPTECATYPWSRWDECSAKCGPGKQYRTREFKSPTSARQFKCRNSLREEQACLGRKCNSFNEENPNNSEIEILSENPECAISGWTEWSSCSTTCGTGVIIRSRNYLNPRAKKKCQKVSRVQLQEIQKCEGIDCGGDIGSQTNDNTDNDNNSSDTSRVGFKQHSADINSNDRFSAFESYSQKLEENIPPECGVSHWSDFSPCIGPCGEKGQRQRERKVWNNNNVYNLRYQDDGLDPCRHIKLFETVNCTNPDCNVIVPTYCYEKLKPSHCRDSDVNNYWFYDHLSDQCTIFWADKCDKNHNKFNSKELCEETCRQPEKYIISTSKNLGSKIVPMDCLVSDWQTHGCNTTCGEGFQIKIRKVLRIPKFGGKSCPKHLVRLEKCYQRCDDMYSVGGTDGSQYGDNIIERDNTTSKIINECQYSAWSSWTPCTASCGDHAVRQKTRILVNTDLNYKCKDRVRIEKCVSLPCFHT